MIAIQVALQVSETDMGYALLIDTVNYSIWIVFLLWSIPLAPKFNRWTQANTQDIDMLAKQTIPESEKKPITFQSLTLLLGLSFLISVISQGAGKWLGANFSILDAGTWTVLFITVLGLLAALTPLEQVPGANEVSNILLYLIVALLASRASLAQIGSAAIWILTGFIIMTIHGILLVFLCKLFKLDLFTGAVGSLANIGGTASAPILAGAYSSALVPLGILMALIGYVVGTPLGLFTAKIMELLA